MGGGKKDVDISITGGADPRDDYAPIFGVLDIDWATFEDGAGDVELMAFGDWVDDGGPPWYYEFTTLTLSDYDYFGFSLYLFFTNEVADIGSLAADGDYVFVGNRVYIYGISGSAPGFDGYMHACSNQLTLIGGGPLDMPEQPYPPGETGIRKIGDLHNGTLKYTGVKNIHFQKYGNKVHAFGEGSRNDADWDQGETDRLGFFYSNDGGVTFQWSSQWLYNEPIPYDNPSPPPLTVEIDANDTDVALGSTPIRVGNATSNLTSIGEYTGFIPMSPDGTLMVWLKQSSSDFSFWASADGGASWWKSPHFTPQAIKWSLPSGVWPGNRFEAEAACRDARAIVDPDPETGWPWVFYTVDRRQGSNNLVTKIDLADPDKSVPGGMNPGYLKFWLSLGAPIAAVNWTATKQNAGAVFTGRPWWISSTVDVDTVTMWLHVVTLHTDGHYRYYRSSDEGVTWSGVQFQATHDPNYVASGGNSEQRGLRSGYSPNLLTSPNSRDLWMILTYGEQNGPFTDYGSNHIYRSLDHGVTWDKLSEGISGDHPYAKGMTRGSGGFLNAQSPGRPQLMFINDSYDEFILRRDKWYFEEFTYWRVNRTGTHSTVIEETYDISIDEREYFNYFHAGGSSPIWGAGNIGADFPCGIASGSRNWSVLDQWHMMAPNRADFSDNFGGYNCINSWHSNGALLNPYARGGFAEVTIAPTDATFYNICDEAGFIIRAQHVNELKTKLQQLNNTVQARGTKPTKFGIDFIMPDGNTLPVIEPNNEAQPVRADHYTTLRREFETKIRSEVGTAPGGWVYTDDGVDLTDIEYDMPLPSDDGFTAVSIRTLLGMRKIIQALYTNGWFCACYSYCPCQTDIAVSGGGSKK